MPVRLVLSWLTKGLIPVAISVVFCDDELVLLLVGVIIGGVLVSLMADWCCLCLLSL